MGIGGWVLLRGIVYPCFASQKATWGSSCVWVVMRRMEVCVSFEQANFCAWVTWRDVAWLLEMNVLQES